MHKRDHDQEFAQPRVQARVKSLESQTIPSNTYPNKLSNLPDENDENITKVYLKAKNELFHESIVRSPLNAIQAGVFWKFRSDTVVARWLSTKNIDYD